MENKEKIWHPIENMLFEEYEPKNWTKVSMVNEGKLIPCHKDLSALVFVFHWSILYCLSFKTKSSRRRSRRNLHAILLYSYSYSFYTNGEVIDTFLNGSKYTLEKKLFLKF